MATSIAELKAAGVHIEPDEAVAIALQLIAALKQPHADADLQPPFGPPSAANVSLQPDGRVRCHGCGTTPAVSEVGIFLHALLQDGPARVPGGLRYTIARALLDVDVPPFDSLDDFSRDLARHEHGEPAAVVRGLLTRVNGDRAGLTVAAIDRRHRHAPASDLRRALREADVRLYEYQRSHDVVALKPQPPRARTGSAIAACLAAGIALICTGEVMHKRMIPSAAAPAPAIAESTAPSQPLAPEVSPIAATDDARVPSDRGIIAVRDVSPAVSAASASGSRPEIRRVSIKRTRRAAPVVTRSRPRPQSRSVFDSLRLGWLRNAFTKHADL